MTDERTVRWSGDVKAVRDLLVTCVGWEFPHDWLEVLPNGDLYIHQIPVLIVRVGQSIACRNNKAVIVGDV